MPTYIQSMHNDRIKRAARLRDRRGRQKQQRIIVDGLREVARALEAGVTPREVYVDEQRWAEREIQILLNQLPLAEVEVAQDMREDVIAKRMLKSWDEISHWGYYDYVLINDDLDETEEKLKTIVSAERMRRIQQPALQEHVRRLQAEFEELS